LIEFFGDHSIAFACGPSLPNERPEVVRACLLTSAPISSADFRGARPQFWVRVLDAGPQRHASVSRRGIGRLDSIRDQLRLVFGDGRQYVKGKLIGLRKIDRNEFNSGLHEPADHVNVSGESIEVSNDQDSMEKPAEVQSLTEFWPIDFPSAHCLREFGDELSRIG
jgi:hypothetical protein